MKSIDSFPTHKKGNLEYRIGRVLPFGASIIDDGINFSIFSKEATKATLVLFKNGEREPFEEIEFPDEFRIGNVFSMMVFGLNIDEIEYGYRFDGPYNAQKGHIFDNTKILLDPYAKSVSGRCVWGQEPEKNSIFVHRGRVIREDYDWEGDTPLRIPMEKLIIYELHIRSFTMHESSNVDYKGTFSGLKKKIDYIKELGINCVELMPIFEFDEFENSREINGNKLYNYWGYSTVNFFAPKAGYAKSSAFGMESDELKSLIKHLHRNGIEVILDVVFNHTAEGNEKGPYISYKGIDNRTYYLLTPEGYYNDFSGCGNTMNCNNAVVRNCILDALRYWVSAYHIDGFRFDLASILSRDEFGTPMMSPPILETLAHDPVLGGCKLIAEAWDAGGLYQVGRFPSWKRWAEWNGKYRDCARKLIKGGAEMAPEMYVRIGGSPDMYADRSTTASINFITCHDGFTMYDLVSYNEKHNENNGEDNRDGCNDNDSWNCGIEGETEDKAVNELRLSQIKNFFTLLLTSRGVPMILSGDEFANTQFGNNNAYCQDNNISYLDWQNLEKYRDLYEYVKTLIEFRKAHPVIRNKYYDYDKNGTGYPELSFHSTTPWELDLSSPNLTFSYLYAEDHVKFKTENDAYIYVIFNAHWEEHIFNLPIIPAGFRWERVVSSFHMEDEIGFDSITIPPRSSCIIIANPKKIYH